MEQQTVNTGHYIIMATLILLPSFYRNIFYNRNQE